MMSAVSQHPTGAGTRSRVTDVAGTVSLSPGLRPNLVRRDTDQILSYYQSEHAGRSFDQASAEINFESQPQYRTTTSHVPPLAFGHGRQPSSFSSTSEYSSNYSEPDTSFSLVPTPAPTTPFQVPTPRTSTGVAQPEASSGHGHPARHSRRPSVPTEGGADRRRLAIVEMDAPLPAPHSVGRTKSRGFDGKSSLIDPPSSSSSMSPATLFSRRGIHIGGLALVAPPDASPNTYTDLTPPSTAPIPSGSTGYASTHPTHTRSASEAVNTSGSHSRLRHKSSRDVGIIGLSSASTAAESVSAASPSSEDYHVYAQCEGLGVPLFQTPAKSRSPSPGATPELSDTSSPSVFRSPHQRLLSTPIFGMDDAGIITPGIGEGKDIQQPVVGPIIVGLSSELLHGAQRTTNVSAAVCGSHHAHSPSSTSSPYPSSPYLHYQPGIHATAGPLPPPPRSIFDRGDTTTPPRPPRLHTPLPPSARRDIDAIKEALQLPQSVSAKLAARTPPETEERFVREASLHALESRKTRSQESIYSEESEPEPFIRLLSTQPVHKREGAFPPSKILTSPRSSSKQRSLLLDQQSASPSSDAHPVVVIEQGEGSEEDRRPGLELHWEGSWVSLGQAAARRFSSPNGGSAALPAVPVSRSPSSVSEASSSSSVSQLPFLPPKSIRHTPDDDRDRNASLAPSAFKVLTNLKRFSSLPRTPSRSSKSSKRSTSPEPLSASPPPNLPVFLASPPRSRPRPQVKYVHTWPAAMNAADVVVLRSASERAKGYAMKISELSMYDCGLREWMTARNRGLVSHPRAQSQRMVLQQPMQEVPVEFGGMDPNTPRHVSHGSMASEATFPIRADAYMATDLSARPTDIAPSTAPPPSLPYPSLAQAQLHRPPARSSTLRLSPTKTLQIPLPGTKAPGTGFFASLGRKTSVRKDKDKGGFLSSTPTSPTKMLMKRPQVIAMSHSNPTPPRPTQQPGPPSIPGGPRAAPGHLKRAKTFSIGSSLPNPGLVEASPSPPLPESTSKPQPSLNNRQSTLASRRPSLFARARQTHTSNVPSPNKAPDVVMDPAFRRQVDKLADLLPHADRAVLAGYLRRAGEDILAIGQYLEDERNGTLKRD